MVLVVGLVAWVDVVPLDARVAALVSPVDVLAATSSALVRVEIGCIRSVVWKLACSVAVAVDVAEAADSATWTGAARLREASDVALEVSARLVLADRLDVALELADAGSAKIRIGLLIWMDAEDAPALEPSTTWVGAATSALVVAVALAGERLTIAPPITMAIDVVAAALDAASGTTVAACTAALALACALAGSKGTTVAALSAAVALESAEDAPSGTVVDAVSDRDVVEVDVAAASAITVAAVTAREDVAAAEEAASGRTVGADNAIVDDELPLAAPNATFVAAVSARVGVAAPDAEFKAMTVGAVMASVGVAAAVDAASATTVAAVSARLVVALALAAARGTRVVAVTAREVVAAAEAAPSAI